MNRHLLSHRCLLMILLSFLAGISASVAPAAEPADSEWTTVQPTPVPLEEEVVGTLNPKVVTTLSSKVMGNVLEVLKREGDMVKADELLVRIDAKDIGSDLAAAKAGLNEAQAAASEIDQHLAAARSAKASAESGLKLARDSFDRISRLFTSKSVTRQEFDQAQTSFRQAEEGVRQAEAQIAALHAKRSQVSARSSQAQAAISKVSTIKALAEVRSPFTGRITKRQVEPGMLAAPGVPLLVLEDSDHILFEAIVPERLLRFLPEGTGMTVTVDAAGSVEFPGTVAEIVPSAERMSHTFIVKIAIDNDPRLRTGMYARGRVCFGEEQVLLVPASAVEFRGQLEGVYLDHDGKPLFRLVRIGRTHGGQVEILSGLLPGDRVAKDAGRIRKGG